MVHHACFKNPHPTPNRNPTILQSQEHSQSAVEKNMAIGKFTHNS